MKPCPNRQEERPILLQAGVFRAAGMREARAGVRVAARRAHVRLRATGGPPAGAIFLGLAHFHAGAVCFGFRAMAVATARGNAAQQGRRVSQERQRAGNEECRDR